MFLKLKSKREKALELARQIYSSLNYGPWYDNEECCHKDRLKFKKLIRLLEK